MKNFLLLVIFFPTLAFADFSCDEEFPPGDWKNIHCNQEDISLRIAELKAKIDSDLDFKEKWRLDGAGQEKYVAEYRTILESFEASFDSFAQNFCDLYLFTGGLWAGSGESESRLICSSSMLAEKEEKYISLLAEWPYVTQPSFDCNRATTNVERMICSNDQLTTKDNFLSDQFNKILDLSDDRESQVDEQKSWLTDIRSQCKDLQCLNDSYDRRITELATRLNQLNAESSAGQQANQHIQAHDENRK